MNFKRFLSLVIIIGAFAFLQFSCAQSKKESSSYKIPENIPTPSGSVISSGSGSDSSSRQPESIDSAWELIKKGNINEAEKVLKRYPNNPYGIYGLGLIESKRGNYDKALEYLNKSIEKQSNIHQAFRIRGYAYYFKREYDKSIADFSKAVSLDPNDSENYYGMAMVYQAMGKKKESEEALEQALKLDKDPNRFIRAKRIYLMMRDKEKALEIIRQGYETFPQNPEKIYSYAISLYDQGKISESKKVIDESLKRVAESSKYRIYMLQGEFYTMERDYKKAEESYAKALKLAPPATDVDKASVLAELYVMYGDSFLEQKRYDEAEKWFAKSLEPIQKIKDFGELKIADNKTVEYYVAMARLEMKKGNMEKADEYIKKCEALKPPSAVGDDIGDVARIRAEWYMAKGEFEKAVKVLSEMAQRNPDSLDQIYIKIAEAYCGMKNRQEALNSLKKALEYGNKRRITFFMSESPWFDFIRNDPETKALLK